MVAAIYVVWLINPGVSNISENVSVNAVGLSLTLDNGLVIINFNAGVAESVTKSGINIIVNRAAGDKSFYIDYNGGKVEFKPQTLDIVEQSPERAHAVYYEESSSALTIEYHLVMEQGLSGVYIYVIVSNNASEELMIDELRTICRFDPSLMNHVHNGKKWLIPPLYAELKKMPKIQDETWQLPDGSYYTKYDLADYMRERNFWGIFGGGFGAWTVTASHEYFSGGPLKQDIIVHQDALMAVYMTGAHFGTPTLAAPVGWSKIFGPWLVYFNKGNDDSLISDVQNQATQEIAKWPYTWVSSSLYPLRRGTVKGKVSTIEKCTVILSPPDEQFDSQVKGYSFHTETDENQAFLIKNVRPGQYTLTAYPITGTGAGTLVQQNVDVGEQELDVGDIIIDQSQNVLWSLGVANRRSDGFQYSGETRNYLWETLPPADIIFVIGQSNSTVDWFYAQTKPGTWTIQFLDKPDGTPRHLLLSIAAASGDYPADIVENPHLNVGLNGQNLTTLSYPNDKAIYRGAIQSGNYHFENIEIPASAILDGQNNITLNIAVGSKFMYDIIVFTD